MIKHLFWAVLVVLAVVLLGQPVRGRSLKVVEKLRDKALRINMFGAEKLRAFKLNTAKLTHDIRHKIRHPGVALWKEKRLQVQGPMQEVDLQRSEARDPVMVGKVVSWLVRKVMRSRKVQSDGLHVTVSQNTRRSLANGDLGNVKLTFDSILHPKFSISGGGIIHIEGLGLNMRRLFARNLQSVREPHRVSCDITLTSEDLSQSTLVRHLAQSVVDSLLLKALNNNAMDIVVTGVAIRESRVVASGVVSMLADASKSAHSRDHAAEGDFKGTGLVNVGFEISTLLGTREESPSILAVQEPLIVLNPLSNILRAQVPLRGGEAAFDVDLGEGCFIHRVEVSNGEIAFAASAPVSALRALAVTHGRPASTGAGSDALTMNGAALMGLELAADAAVSGASTLAGYLAAQVTDAAGYLYSVVVSPFSSEDTLDSARFGCNAGTDCVGGVYQSHSYYYSVYSALVSVLGRLWW